MYLFICTYITGSFYYHATPNLYHDKKKTMYKKSLKIVFNDLKSELYLVGSCLYIILHKTILIYP